MFLSREIDIKLCQNYTKTYTYEILFKSFRLQYENETDLIQQIRNKFENYYIPQEPKNLRFAPVIIFNFYFAFLIDIIENIITYVCVVRITSPELPTMAVQYRCRMSPAVSHDQFTKIDVLYESFNA